MPNEIADRVFETNQRRDMNIGIREIKNGVLGSAGEIARHPRACDGGEQRKGFPQRNIFAEGDEMNLVVKFGPAFRGGNKDGGVVRVFLVDVVDTEKKIGLI